MPPLVWLLVAGLIISGLFWLVLAEGKTCGTWQETLLAGFLRVIDFCNYWVYVRQIKGFLTGELPEVVAWEALTTPYVLGNWLFYLSWAILDLILPLSLTLIVVVVGCTWLALVFLDRLLVPLPLLTRSALILLAYASFWFYIFRFGTSSIVYPYFLGTLLVLFRWLVPSPTQSSANNVNRQWFYASVLLTALSFFIYVFLALVLSGILFLAAILRGLIGRKQHSRHQILVELGLITFAIGSAALLYKAVLTGWLPETLGFDVQALLFRSLAVATHLPAIPLKQLPLYIMTGIVVPAFLFWQPIARTLPPGIRHFLLALFWGFTLAPFQNLITGISIQEWHTGYRWGVLILVIGAGILLQYPGSRWLGIFLAGFALLFLISTRHIPRTLHVAPPFQQTCQAVQAFTHAKARICPRIRGRRFLIEPHTACLFQGICYARPLPYEGGFNSHFPDQDFRTLYLWGMLTEFGDALNLNPTRHPVNAHKIWNDRFPAWSVYYWEFHTRLNHATILALLNQIGIRLCNSKIGTRLAGTEICTTYRQVQQCKPQFARDPLRLLRNRHRLILDCLLTDTLPTIDSLLHNPEYARHQLHRLITTNQINGICIGKEGKNWWHTVLRGIPIKDSVYVGERVCYGFGE